MLSRSDTPQLEIDPEALERLDQFLAEICLDLDTTNLMTFPPVGHIDPLVGVYPIRLIKLISVLERRKIESDNALSE